MDEELGCRGREDHRELSAQAIGDANRRRRQRDARTGAHLPIGFFVWHDRLEAQHARHTQEELEEYYFQSQLDEDAFIRYGNEMLDGVAAFWDGLEEQRTALAA